MTAESDATTETPGSGSGPLGALTSSLQQGRDLLAGVADVAALESRLAAQSLTQMLALAAVEHRDDAGPARGAGRRAAAQRPRL